MQGGDISNVVSPRLVIVFEGLLGMLPSAKARAQEAAYRKARRWKRAAGVYEINEDCAKNVWDVTWRFGYSLDVVTYLGDEMADAVAERLDQESLPVSNTWATTPQQLARRISLMPDIAAIFDPNPSHRFTYGSKGRLINPTTPHLMGAF